MKMWQRGTVPRGHTVDKRGKRAGTDAVELSHCDLHLACRLSGRVINENLAHCSQRLLFSS